MLRVGKRAIVSFPNFAHWQVRLHLVFGGRMPQTPSLPYKWYDTPNIHLCTLSDFLDLTRLCGAAVVEAHALNENGETRRMRPDAILKGTFGGPNLWAPGAIFLLKKA